MVRAKVICDGIEGNAVSFHTRMRGDDGRETSEL